MKKIIKNAIAKIKLKINSIPDIAVILGSGLGELSDELTNKVEFSYGELGLCESTVSGHNGMLIFGTFHNKFVCFLKGRVHLYEGYSAKQVVLPIYLLKELGVNNLIITNAAGAVNTNYNIGDIILVEDVINLTGQNPLVGGALINYGDYFIDMSNLFKLNNNIKGLKCGVYAQLLGPSYETKSEIEYLRKIGVDLVGMSTVMEVIAGKQCKMEMGCLSLVTNATGNSHMEKLSHEEVLDVAKKSKDNFKQIVKYLINSI